MEMTRERTSFIFNQRDMLSLQIRFSFVRAAVAFSILERISVLDPSSEKTDSRYLKLDAERSFCPFTLITLWSHWRSLVFSSLSCIFHLVQVLSRLSTRTSCPVLPQLRQIADWEYFWHLCKHLHHVCFRTSDMFRLRKLLKRVGDRRHPCLTPTVVLNRSVIQKATV